MPSEDRGYRGVAAVSGGEGGFLIPPSYAAPLRALAIEDQARRLRLLFGLTPEAALAQATRWFDAQTSCLGHAATTEEDWMEELYLIGSRSFGVAVAKELQMEGHRIGAVWAPVQDSLRVWARTQGIATPVTMDGLVHLASARQPRLVVCAHNTRYVPERVRECARLGAVSYHPSLLPRHRGRDAVRWTVHMKDPIAGGTVYRLTEGVDTGPILRQDWCFVDPAWSASDLWRTQLFPMGIRLLADVAAGAPHVPKPQNERYATWEPSWERGPLNGGRQ